MNCLSLTLIIVNSSEQGWSWYHDIWNFQIHTFINEFLQNIKVASRAFLILK